jgi:CHAT domain-containing protein
MFAGASSVVVSLWQVADESTAELMKYFYTEIATGKDKVAALAFAKSKLRERGKSSPFFWAPFIIWGE